MKIKLSKTDKIWSKMVRERDGECLHCGAKENLNAHHLFGRSKSATRYELTNGFTLCVLHHTFSPDWSAHRTEQTFKIWAKKRIGTKEFNRLKKLSNSIMSRKKAERLFLENI